MSTLSLTRTFGITRRWGAFYDRWLRRRLPPSDRIILEQRRLFIFPTRRGFFFMLTLLVMLLTAINYQNNLVYGVTFWLALEPVKCSAKGRNAEVSPDGATGRPSGTRKEGQRP